MTDKTRPVGVADGDVSLFGMNQAKPSHAGHRSRLRKRFVAAPGAVPDYEVLELLLFGVIARADTKDLSKSLLARFGTLAKVLAADEVDLKRVDGCGDAVIAMLKAVREASLRTLRHDAAASRDVLSSWQKLLDYCNARMAENPIEEFRVIFLDRKNGLIADEAQSRGTVDHTPVYPREVVKRALELHASACIVVHNHPSGDPTPSRADIEMTRLIRDALKAVGIDLHDHVVIGRGRHVSFRTLGLIKEG